MPKKRPVRSALSDPVPATASELLRIDARKDQLSPAQQAFNRLTLQVEQSRAALQRWEQFAQQLHERVGDEMVPLNAALLAAKRELIVLIDALLSPPPVGVSITKRRRAGLAAYLIMLIDAVLAHGPDGAIEDIHDRHSSLTLAARRDIDAKIELELAEQMVRDSLGEDYVAFDHGAKTAEEFLRQVDATVTEERAERERARDARRAKRARRDRKDQPTAADAGAQAAQAASQSVRDIYRKLVSSLHPDRESDPDERERKTGLMMRINGAYQSGDLLTLLSLQMEVEQIDAASIARLPEERLRHYNEVLRQQLRTLNAEIEAQIERLQQQADSGGGRPPREPQAFDRLFTDSMRAARQSLRYLVETLQSLQQPELRKRMLDEIAEAMGALESAEDEEFRAAMAASFLDEVDPFADDAPTPTRRRSKQRRR